MKNYKNGTCTFIIRFSTKNGVGVFCSWRGDAKNVDDAIMQCSKCIPTDDKISSIKSIVADNNKLLDEEIEIINNKLNSIDECDGGAAVGGADGGAAIGDSGAVSVDGGEIAPTDVSGIKNADVLGHCNHEKGEGYFGPGCFHIPSKVKVPFHRWEIGNGGSKRKKNKKGKDKKYEYEKGMKVVVDMFESNSIPSNVNIWEIY